MKTEIKKTDIPTYVIGDYEKNPIFFEKRNVQAAMGSVFPMAFNNRMCVDFKPVTYEQIVLENEFIEVSVLPEIGGRIYSALDKSNSYDFIYKNHVIKPQQIGLTGPWISGGIEFNWPQHHRPTTFLPVEWALEKNEDGSSTIWMGEVDPLYRTKGMVGITVHPGRSYIEAKVRLFNRTPFPQSFMWWANVAVAVNENYRAIFPKDIHWSSDHAWVTTAPFPFLKGEVNGVDYGNGTDVQNYDSVGGSYFTYNSKYDFLAGYDDGRDGGVVHVANRHIGTGKKIFNWGVSEFGEAWAKNLSDEDGPYVELMTGLYTRNQPDFSWMMPHEYKTAEQFWYPIRNIRDVANASLDGALGLEFEGDNALIDVNSTQRRTGASVVLRCNGKVLLEERMDIAPDRPFSTQVALGEMESPQAYEVLFIAEEGRELLQYRPEVKPDNLVIPAPLAPSPSAEELKSVEDIYLHSLHIWQYKHPYLRAEEYLQAAMEREPEDLRCNTLLGRIWMDKGDFDKAEHHFNIAVQRSTQRNPNPYDTEPFFNLAVLQCLAGNHESAYENFYRAIWGYAWKSVGYCHLAQLDCRSSDHAQALKHIELSLETNASNLKALRVKASILRNMGRLEEALVVVQSLTDRDKLDFVAAFERVLICRTMGDDEAAQAAYAEFIRISRKNPEYFICIAVEYAEMGSYCDAIDALSVFTEECEKHPIIEYYMGYYHQVSGHEERAGECFRQASSLPVEGILHSRLESIVVLNAALEFDPNDNKSPYYLGNIYYGKEMFDQAIEYFSLSVDRQADFPTVYRNLAIGLFDKKDQVEEAGSLLRHAFAMNPADERVFYELIQYERNTGVPLADRLKLIENHPHLHDGTDEVYLKIIATYLENRDYEKVKSLLAGHVFHPYEGGEGILPALHVDAFVGMGKKCLRNGEGESAISCFEAASEVPDNYLEGAIPHLRSISDYYIGTAWEVMGDQAKAEEYFQSSLKRAAGRSDQLNIAGLCLLKLGRKDEADSIFETLLNIADKRQQTNGDYPYFTQSLVFTLPFEHDLKKNNDADCAFLQGLGWKGLGEVENAKAAFVRALALKPYMYRAADALSEIQESTESGKNNESLV